MAKNNLHTKKVTAAMPQLRSPQSVDMSLFNSQMSRLNSVKAQSGISKSAQNIINAMASNVQKSEKNARSIINAAKKKEKKLEADLAKYRVLEKNAETDKSANQQFLEKRLSGKNLFPVKKSASSETEKPKSELSDVSRQLFTADELNGTATVGIKDVNNLTDNDFQILKSRAQQRLATEIRRSGKKQDKTKIDALKSFISNIPAAGTEPTTAQSTPQNKSVNTALGNIQNRNTFQKTSSSEPVNTVLGNVQNRNTFPKQSNSTPVNTVLGNVQNRNTFPKTGDSIQEKIYKKYNINTDTFNNKDLSKWVNDTGAFKNVTDNINSKSGSAKRFALMKTLFTGKAGENGISDDTLRDEYRVLKAVADNNERKNTLEQSYINNDTVRKAAGNVRSAAQSMSNAATLGLTNRFSDMADEEQFKRTGLSKDKLVKTTDVIKSDYGAAETVGNAAGDMLSYMAINGIVKGTANIAKNTAKGIKGAVTAAKAGEIAKELNTAASFKNVSTATKAPIKFALEKAFESGAAFGLQSFARTGIETGDLKQAAKSGAVSGVSGGVGSGASAYVGVKLGKLAETYSEKAIAKKLAKNVGRPLDKNNFADLSEAKQYVDALYKNFGLKEYFYPRAFVNFATAGAFVTASTGASVGMQKMLYDNYNPTAKDIAKTMAEQTLIAFGLSMMHTFSEYGKLSSQNKMVAKNATSEMEQCLNTMRELKNSGNVSSQEYSMLENEFQKRVKVMQNIVNSGEMVGSAKEQRELKNTLRMLNDYGKALKVIKDNGSYKILEQDKPKVEQKTETPSAVNVKYREAANAETDLFSEAPNGNIDTSAQTSAVQPFARRSGGRNIQYEQNSEPVQQPVAPTAEQPVEPQPFARRMSKQPTQNVSSDTEDFFPTPENAAVNDEVDFTPTPEKPVASAPMPTETRQKANNTNYTTDNLTFRKVGNSYEMYGDDAVKFAGKNGLKSENISFSDGMQIPAVRMSDTDLARISNENGYNISAHEHNGSSYVTLKPQPTAPIDNTMPNTTDTETANAETAEINKPIAEDKPINPTFERMFEERRTRSEATTLPKQTTAPADISSDIRNQLANGVKTIDEITRNLGVNVGNVNSTLFSMELNGEVKRKAGNTYELTDTAAKNNQTDMIKSVSTDNSITSHKDNIASNDSNDILHTVENTIYPQFKENAVGLFEKEYGGNGFSGFADRLIENYKSDGDIGKGERAFFADNGESVTKLIADAVKNERGGGENISDRTYESVGSRNVKAFQYTYPQLKKYYSEIANELLGDIKSTVKGEKTPIFAEDGSISGYTGTPRQTSSSIERIKDTTGASYDKITDALNRIITDNGQENIALAKRIELVMDDMLSDGYTAFDGTDVPPNENYIAEKGKIEGESTNAGKNNQVLNDYSKAVNDIATEDDKTALKNAENRVAIKIMDNTPDVILNNVQESKDLPIMINYTKLYLAVRESGVINGNYHNLGTEIANKLPDMLTSPDAIIQLANGRLNLLSQVTSDKGNNALVSVELNSNKDIDGKNKNYNVVVTLFASDDNYIKNITSKDGVSLRYEKKDLSQVNPQLYNYLATINDKSSVDNSLSQDKPIVNNNSMQKSENNTDVSPESILKKLSHGENVSIDDVKAAVNFICDNEADIKADLSKLTNAELKQKMNIVDRGSYSKKADMVNVIYNDMLSRAYYTISGKDTMSMTMFDGKSFTEQTKDLVNSELNSLTEERLKTLTEKYSEEYKKRAAAREERKKSIENPQTLDDYLRKKRTVGLSESENSDFERLYAVTRKERRTADKAGTSSSKTAAADDFLKNNDNFTVEESTHSKTGEKIWVVKPKERLATDEWKNINSSMKSLGGFYWKGNGGWNFKENPIAEIEPEVSAVQGSHSEKLRTIADNMQKSIDECFKDRLTNTAKRAREAASATDKGEKLQRTQATIRNIADGIESGNIKLLTDIDSKAQVDTLFRMLILAQNNRIKAIDGITYSERLKEQEKPYGNDDIKHAKLPLDTVYSGIVEEYAKAADGKAGYKMIHSRLEKAVKGAKDDYVHITPQLFEDISKVVKNLDTIRDDYWNDGVSELNRLKRMGIENNAELRAYLREFVEHIPGVDAEAEQKKAIKQKEIELANSKIDGFFPTPKNIVEKMLDEADIKKGETVLEPSAGKGNIADEIRTQYPDNALEVAEINGSLAELLKEKGHNIVGNDFLATNKKYDKIIMNPPFEKLQDIDHVKHAYDMLNPGGRLVAIMSESPFFNSAKKAEAFRTWLEDVGGVSEKLPENSFKNSERSTGVNTRLVVIDKGTETPSGKSNPNEKYSLDNHSDNSEWWSGDIKKATAEFSNQIDKWQRGEMKSSEHFDLGRTPVVLQNMGADNLPVIMTQKVMNKITGGKHDIDLTELKKLPKNISEPVMVFKSATTPNAYVILTEMTDKNGDSIITAMHLNRYQDRININRIASVYGKENIGNFVNKQTDAGNLIYADKNKSQQWSTSRGLRLPKLVQSITDNNNISQKSDVVNTHNTQKSEKYALSRPTFEKTDSKPKTSKKTVPVKSPRDIVRYISDTFNIPISTGNIGKGNANGVYKMPSQTIRTRITNDLPVISHELGHMLDDKYGLSNAKHINEALNYAYKLDPDFIDQYSGEEQDGEAIGQFVKSYLINPQKAKSGAAQFYKEFAEALSKEDMNALNQASKFIREYISADFMDRVHSNTVTNKELKESTPISEKAKTFYTKIVDDFDPIKHAVDFVEKVDGYQTGAKNAYTLAMNSKNAASISAFILREGMVDKDGNIVGKSFIECLSPIPEKQLDTFADYLLLKHSLEWLKPLDGSEPKRVFSDDTLQDVDEINKWISYIEKEFPHFKTAAKDIYEFQNNLMKYWCVDIGGMSESLFKALQERYPCYVPLYRAIIGGKRGIKSTFANQRIPINRAKGSGETIINVLESIMYNTEKFVKFGTHNQVMQNLADYADNVKGFGNFMEKVLPNKIPHVVDISAKIDKLKDVMSGLNDSDFSSLSEALDDILGSSVTDYTPVAIAGKQIVTVLRNGKAEYYQIHDKALFDAVANMTPKQLGTFAKLSRKILMPTNLLITQFNYLFGSKNVIRDFQTGYAHTQAYNTLAEYTAGYFRALGHIWKNSPEYKEYKAVGGGHMSNFSGCVDQLQKALHDIEQKDKGLATRMAYSIICHPIESIVSLNEIMETIPRLAEYEGMIKNGADRQAASLAAADITVNFNRSGEIGRELNSVFRFSNAAMQGMDKEIRTFTTGGKKNILKHIMRYVVSAILTTALIEAWNRKDKDSRKAWDNLANYQKNNFYCLYIGNGNFFKLPKAREVSVLNTLIERSIDYAFGNKDAFYQFGEYLGNTILPGYIPTTLNAKEALHDILGETALSGVADVAFNEDFKGSPIVSRSLENEAPKNQYNNKTSWLAYELGQLMNISPMKADHIIDNYGGVFGKINRSIGAKDSKQIDKSLGFKNTFITDSAYSTDTFNYMYDRRDKAEEKFKNDPTPENAALYQSYATGCSLITNSRKLIYDMPEDKQKAAQNKLIDTVKQYRKEHSKGDALIAKSFGKGLRYDSRGTDLPDNEISYKSNGKTVKQGLTFDQYMTFVKDYMNIADTKQKEVIRTDEYKKSDYDTKQKKLSKARSEAKKKAVQNIMSKIKE